MTVSYYSSLGLVVSVRGEDAIRSRVDDLYADCRVAPTARVGLDLEIVGDGTTGGYELRADGVPCARSADCDGLLDWVAWKINDSAVRIERAELVLHAAAVARAGKAILLTGPSGAGKSTLAAGLTRRGAAYMGDDSLVVDSATVAIRSNPKPISIDAAARAALLQAGPTDLALRRAFARELPLVAPHELGPIVAVDEAVSPVLIMHSRFRAGVADIDRGPDARRGRGAARRSVVQLRRGRADRTASGRRDRPARAGFRGRVGRSRRRDRSDLRRVRRGGRGRHARPR